jgi:hypothetical protein
MLFMGREIRYLMILCRQRDIWKRQLVATEHEGAGNATQRQHAKLSMSTPFRHKGGCT